MSVSKDIVSKSPSQFVGGQVPVLSEIEALRFHSATLRIGGAGVRLHKNLINEQKTTDVLRNDSEVLVYHDQYTIQILSLLMISIF